MPSATEILKWSFAEGCAAGTLRQRHRLHQRTDCIAATSHRRDCYATVTAAAEPSIAIPDDGRCTAIRLAEPPLSRDHSHRQPQRRSSVQHAKCKSQRHRRRKPSCLRQYTATDACHRANLRPQPWHTPQSQLRRIQLGGQLTLPPPPAPTSVRRSRRHSCADDRAATVRRNEQHGRSIAGAVPVAARSITTRRRRVFACPAMRPTPYVGSDDGFSPRTSMR